MKPIERLIARVVQLVEDNPAQVVTITITIDDKGQPYCWVVTQQRSEGLQRREEQKI